MPTLTDLLRIPALGLRQEVSGRPDQPVRWVTTSELTDPTPYLEGGELLLTTGLVDHADGWTGDWAGYVDRLAGAGVIGLGFGVGLSHAEVPADVIDAAAARGLALLVVPESTPFIAISKALARLIAEEENASTSAALAVQHELTRAISKRDGVRRVLTILARTSGGEAGLVDAEGRGIAPPRFRPGDTARRALSDLRARRHRAAVTEVARSGTTVVQPIGTGATPDAFLVLTARTPPDGVVRAALATTVALLTLDAERSRAARDAEMRVMDCAARLVLDGSPEAARSVAALLTGGPELPATVQVIRVNGLHAGAREQIAHAHPAALISAADGRGAILVDPSDAPPVERLLAGLGCRVGTGTAVPVAQAGLSDAAATGALAATTARNPVVRWDERFRGDVRSGLTDDAAQVLATRILGSLGDEPELRRTLRAYLTHLGHWQPTADELGIHRNTLRKRIARIETLTGRRVDTAAGRADLWIALEIADEHLPPAAIV